MRLVMFVLAFTLMVLSLSPAAFGFGIGLQPTTVEMEVGPGERHRQVINLANVHQEQTISLTIGLADWSLTEDGQIDLSPPGETERSSADWVRFSPAFVTLEPGESAQVVVDIALPARIATTGDHRFALLASTILPEERGAGSGVWRRYQLASLFYLTVGDSESRPVVTSSGLAIGEDGSPLFGLRIENSGNAHARLDGVVEVTTASGVIDSVPVSNLVVLDGAARNYQVPLSSDLVPGASLRVRLENTFAPQVSGGFEVLEPFVFDLPALSSAPTSVEPGNGETELP